jgi:hypothetical protein
MCQIHISAEWVLVCTPKSLQVKTFSTSVWWRWLLVTLLGVAERYSFRSCVEPPKMDRAVGKHVRMRFSMCIGRAACLRRHVNWTARACVHACAWPLLNVIITPDRPIEAAGGDRRVHKRRTPLTTGCGMIYHLRCFSPFFVSSS